MPPESKTGPRQVREPYPTKPAVNADKAVKYPTQDPWSRWFSCEHTLNAQKPLPERSDGVCKGHHTDNPRKMTQKKLKPGNTEELAMLKKVAKYCETTSPTPRSCSNVVSLLREGYENISESVKRTLLYTPYYEGGSLANWIQYKDSRLTKNTAPITWDVYAGLSLLQKLQLVHCDIKSENIFLNTKAGVAKAVIGDFSLVATVNQIQAAGDPRYMRICDTATPVKSSRDKFAWMLIVYEMMQSKIAPWCTGTDLPTAGAYDTQMWAQYSKELNAIFGGTHIPHSLVAFSSLDMTFGTLTPEYVDTQNSNPLRVIPPKPVGARLG
jgi:serine/threonine protein kinase